MDVFISWSGVRSGAAAKALSEWLPMVINALKPWLSSDDIKQGTRWAVDLASKLSDVKAGIICLTPSNLHKDWILFEAGALSKTLKDTYVCPLLIDLTPNDVTGPLAQFQATEANKKSFLRLMKTLNEAVPDGALKDKHLEEAFETWWPKLENKLKELPPDEDVTQVYRSDRQILDEILPLVRSSARSINALLRSDTLRRRAEEWAAARIPLTGSDIAALMTRSAYEQALGGSEGVPPSTTGKAETAYSETETSPDLSENPKDLDDTSP
jgi:hypothetical protein